MKIKNKMVRYICCCNLTLTTRLIGIIGVVISAGLASALVHDKGRNNYNASRITAIILGLDWQYYNLSANATKAEDPQGFIISMGVLLYSILYLITSILLIIATFSRNTWLAVPWLIYEALGCCAKITSMIFHAIYPTQLHETYFIAGCVIYLVVIIWWWLIVFAAQISWMATSATFSTQHASSTYISARGNGIDPSQIELRVANKGSPIESPKPYTPNETYTHI